MRRTLVLSASVPAIALLLIVFALPANVSFSATGEAHPASELLSSSQGTTIKISGDASQKVEPDQISLILDVLSAPSSLDSVSLQSKDTIQKLTDSINSAVGDESRIQMGQTTLNPVYAGGAAPSELATFSAYSTVQLKTDIDHYGTLSSKLTDAGFRVEGISIKEAPKETGSVATEQISVLDGSAVPSNPPYYSPDAVSIKAGTTVVWTNDDAAAHTVTGGTVAGGPDGSFDSNLFLPGSTFEYQFDSEGEYPYFCQVHPWMTGTITVTKGNADNAGPAETAYQVSMNVIVETPPDSIKNAIDLYQKKFDALKQVLDDAGVPAGSIKSNQINFNQNYGQTQYAAYSAYTRMTVNTDAANLDKLMGAVKMPGVSVESLAFTASDQALDKIRKDLTQKALDNALERAKDITDPAGLRITGIKNIEVNPSPNPGQYSNVLTYRGVELSQVQDGSIYQMGQISINVLAEFETAK